MQIKEHFNEYIKFPIVNPKVNKHIEKFVTENIDVLGTIGFNEGLVFGAEREEKVLSLYNFDERKYKKFKRDSKRSKRNKKYDIWKAEQAKKPIYQLLLISHHNSSKKIKNNFFDFLSIIIFTSKYKRQFPFGVNKERMEYTISQLSNRYLLKKNKTLLKTLQVMRETIMDAKIVGKDFDERIKRLNDNDMLQIINRIATSIGLMTRNIANEYYENDTVIWKDEEIMDKDNLRITTNDSIKFDNLKNNIINKNIDYGLDAKILKEIGGGDYIEDFKVMFQNEIKTINNLYELIINDYIKNTPIPGVVYAKKYGFVKYYKNSRKKDKSIKNNISKLAKSYSNKNKSKFENFLNKYLVTTIHRQLQNLN